MIRVFLTAVGWRPLMCGDLGRKTWNALYGGFHVPRPDSERLILFGMLLMAAIVGLMVAYVAVIGGGTSVG